MTDEARQVLEAILQLHKSGAEDGETLTDISTVGRVGDDANVEAYRILDRAAGKKAPEPRTRKWEDREYLIVEGHKVVYSVIKGEGTLVHLHGGGQRWLRDIRCTGPGFRAPQVLRVASYLREVNDE
jgi:hypothetical protein